MNCWPCRRIAVSVGIALICALLRLPVLANVSVEERFNQLMPDKNETFGHSFFKNKSFSFLSAPNIPAPEYYQLGAGDEVTVYIWGNTLTDISGKITSNGNLNIPNLGPVHIAGKTLAQAELHLKEHLGRIYSGILEKVPTTFLKLSLGRMRSVTVDVVGEVETPGSYTLSGWADVAAAVSLAGGPNEIGSVRNIRLYRSDSLIHTLDMYKMFLHGSQDTIVQLKDRDVISVETYAGKVTVLGGVKRPMRYEVLPGESLESLIAYAGGFSPAAYRDVVHVDRTGVAPHRQTAALLSFDIPQAEFSMFGIEAGDEVTVHENQLRFENRVVVSGQVWRPGGCDAGEWNRGGGDYYAQAVD